MLKKSPSESRNNVLVEIGFSITMFLIIATLCVSLYEAVGTSTTGIAKVLKDPEVVALAIGLLISILFVERWRWLVSRMDKLADEQRKVVEEIRDAATVKIDEKVSPLLARAENIRSNILGLAQRHPWLEVITERDIIVETDGIRGILRTCNWLLQDGQMLQLYEYLEYCAKKTTLRGTADDFLEIAAFCETWLGDYSLGAEFVTRFVEKNSSASYILLPHYVTKLTRTGNLMEATAQAKRLLKIVIGDGLVARIKILLGRKKPVSERFRWKAYNAMALAHASIGEDAEMKKSFAKAKGNVFSNVFSLEQKLMDAELATVAGDFASARRSLDELTESNLSPHDLSELSYLYGKIGDKDKAFDIREQVLSRHARSFGDDDREFSRASNKFRRKDDEDTEDDGAAGIGQERSPLEGILKPDSAREPVSPHTPDSPDGTQTKSESMPDQDGIKEEKKSPPEEGRQL